MAVTPAPPAPSGRPQTTLPWRQIILFILVTYAITWALAIPLYLTDDPVVFQTLYTPIALGMMLIPGLTAWGIVHFTKPKGQRAAALGFARHRPVPRFFGYLALAFGLPLVIVLASLPIAAALGVYQADLGSFSGLQQVLAQAGVDDLPIDVLLIGQLINVVLAAWFFNLLPALGEEVGWRGWLTPQLLPLGTVPMILLTGLIWGLWHTPLILLGHNYPHLPGWLAVLFMVVFCILIGAVLAWLSIRTKSVWPAALGHSTVNAVGGLPLLFSAEPQFDTAHVGLTGTTGWLVTALIVVTMLVTKSFKPAPQPTLDPAQAWPGDDPAGDTPKRDEAG